MKTHLIKKTAMAFCLLAAVSCSKSNKSYEPDNSGKNQVQVEPTSEDQQENKTDLKLTQEIRKAVIDDNTLSVNGKNVKIITANGFVTLRGPVETMQEKDNIGNKAVTIAGATKVDNQLEVKKP